jgi:hypothetical protein
MSEVQPTRRRVRIITTMVPRQQSVATWKGTTVIYVSAPAFPGPYFGACRARPPSLAEFALAWLWVLAAGVVRHPVRSWWRGRAAVRRAPLAAWRSAALPVGAAT